MDITRYAMNKKMFGGNGGGSGVTIKNQNKTFTANGTYTADSGYTGLGTVEVAVPETELQDKSVQITQNGLVDVTPDNGKALSKVSVSVAVPEKVPTLQEKTATENGEVVADVGFDGLSKVTVNVQASGGGNDSVVKLIERTATELTADDLNGVTKIGGFAFQDFGTLKKVNLPLSVTAIARYGFYKSSIEDIVLPETITSIGMYAFQMCYSLKSITINGAISRLDTDVFNSCSVLETVTLGNTQNLFSIEMRTFSGCSALKQFEIPSGVKNIGLNAFNNCKALETLTVKATTPPTLGSGALNNTTALTQIIVPTGCGDTYKAATNWSAYADKIVEES